MCTHEAKKRLANCRKTRKKWVIVRWTYQVVLQGVGPDVVLDHLPELVSAGVGVISEPSEEALRLFVLPLPSRFVLCLAGAFGQVLQERKINMSRSNFQYDLVYSTRRATHTFPDFHLISVDFEDGSPLSFKWNSLESSLFSKYGFSSKY